MSTEQTPQRTRARTRNNKTTTDFRVSDVLWAVLLPLLPVHVNTHRFGGGRLHVPDRPCADAIFYVLRTGCQWQALDQTELVPHSTAYDRYQAGCRRMCFSSSGKRVWSSSMNCKASTGCFPVWMCAMTKAPLGGEKTGSNFTDRCKDGVKRSLLTEGYGVLIGLVVAGANRTDMKLVRATLESIVVDRLELTLDQPQGVCLDKGYCYLLLFFFFFSFFFFFFWELQRFFTLAFLIPSRSRLALRNKSAVGIIRIASE